MVKRRHDAPTESIALRAFAVLEEVVRAAAPMSLDEVTHARGLPKPTTFRILSLLQSADLLRREPLTKRYTVGPRLTAFALDLWRQSTLRVQWHRALEEAVEEIGESCNLTILEGDKVLYLDRVETRRPLRLHLEPGTRVPLHCSASGKLFLCQMSRDEVRRLLGPEPLASHTDKTITRYVDLFEDLARVLGTQVGPTTASCSTIWRSRCRLPMRQATSMPPSRSMRHRRARASRAVCGICRHCEGRPPGSRRP